MPHINNLNRLYMDEVRPSVKVPDIPIAIRILYDYANKLGKVAPFVPGSLLYFLYLCLFQLILECLDSTFCSKTALFERIPQGKYC